MIDCLYRKSQGILKKQQKKNNSLNSEVSSAKMQNIRQKIQNLVYFYVLFYFYILSRNTEMPKFKRKLHSKL